MKTRERVALGAVLVLALGLRLWKLGEPVPGFYRDEGIAACQGLALARGITLPESNWNPFDPFPVWGAIEAVSLRVLGPSIFAARLPAAVAGAAVAAFVWVALVPVTGFWPALLAAGFHAASFWELVYGRIAVAPVLMLFQGALLAVFLLGAPAPHPARRGLAAGLVAGSALFGYFAGVHLIVVLAVVAVVRWGTDREFRRMVRPWGLGAAAGVALTACLAFLNRGAFHYLGQYPFAPPSQWIPNLFGHVRAMAFTLPAADPRPGYWGLRAFSGPFLSFLEAGAVILGLTALAVKGPLRRLAAIGLVWAAIALIPAVITESDGPRTNRSLGAVVGLGLLAAAGAAQAGRRWPKALPVLVGGWIAGQALLGGGRYFGPYRHDPRVAFWADRTFVDAALWLQGGAARFPVTLVTADPSYYTMPAVFFLLDPEIRSGRVVVAPPRRSPFVVADAIHDPLRAQPEIFIVSLPAMNVLPRRAYALVTGMALVETAREYLRQRKPRQALDYLWPIVTQVPEFGLGHLRLADVYDNLGDAGAARTERALAAGWGVTETAAGMGLILP
ncbi:MAG: glycosyltransferase family 39 protein [Candidatus Coatesbacteria bacterium]